MPTTTLAIVKALTIISWTYPNKINIIDLIVLMYSYVCSLIEKIMIK